MNEETNVGPPYAPCDQGDYLVSIPNGNPGSSHAFIVFQSRPMEDVRAKHNQHRGAGNCDVSKELKNIINIRPLVDRRCSPLQ